MLGKLRKVSHMAWYCVLTYQASQLAAVGPTAPAPVSRLAPELQKLLQAKAPEATAPMAPPPVPPKRPDLVLAERPGWEDQPAQTRDESPQVPKAKWGAKYIEAPEAPKPASEEASGSGTSQNRGSSRQKRSAQNLSGWDGTKSWGRQGRSPGKGRSPSQKRSGQAQGSEAQAEAQGSERPHRKRAASQRRHSQRPKYQSADHFHSAWATAKPELAALRPRASFYDAPPDRSPGQPIGVYSLSGVRLARTVVDGEATLLMAIPSAVADL
eukprot:2659136-Amphidinium_carterae.1